MEANDAKLYTAMLEDLMRKTEPGVVFMNIDRAKAIEILREQGPSSYVVRPSKQAGSLSVSFFSEDGQFGHTLISKSFDGWAVADKDKTYRSVKELLRNEFYGLRLDGELTTGGADEGDAAADGENYSALPNNLVSNMMEQARSSGHFQPSGGLKDASLADMIRMTEPGIAFSNVSREEGEKALSEAAPGAHIVRPAREDGQLVISYKHLADGSIKHTIIMRVNGGWKVADDEYDAATIHALIALVAEKYGIDPAGMKQAQGAAVPTAAPLGATDFSKMTADDLFGDFDWWKPTFNRAMSEGALVGQKAKALVRKSSDPTQFAVITYTDADGKLYHTPIKHHADGVITMHGLENEIFPTINEAFAFLEVTTVEAEKAGPIENTYDALPTEFTAALLKKKGK